MKKKEKKRKKQTLVIFCVVSFGRMYQPNQRNLSLKNFWLFKSDILESAKKPQHLR